MTAPLNKVRNPPYFTAGLASMLVLTALLVSVWSQFRGDFLARTPLTMIAARSGLSIDSGAKVTYNGVQIGEVGKVEEITRNGQPAAKFTLDVDPKYLKMIPANVHAEIDATTVFGNKYVVFATPEKPVLQRISSNDVIDATHVTTEVNTLFETVVSITRKVDPVKVNQTLTATAQALDGLGERFGQSIIQGNDILGDLNQRMPQLRRDIQQAADLADVYADASPDLWAALKNAVITARTLNDQRAHLDAALMASIGFGNTGADIFERGGPYLVRALQDLVPTSQLADYYSPELFCFVRNVHDLSPKIYDFEAGNGYGVRTESMVIGEADSWVYPDNLPRIDAHGGPEGAPGCWQSPTRDLWPAPYLVMDTGESTAPYNHFGLGQPFAVEYVWGRQVGENTINP